MLTLCSADNWIAVVSLVALSTLPSTTLESPAFATYNMPLQIIPAKQHVPVDAICGLLSHCFFTTDRKPSSVAENALRITFSDMPRCSAAKPALHTKEVIKLLWMFVSI